MAAESTLKVTKIARIVSLMQPASCSGGVERVQAAGVRESVSGSGAQDGGVYLDKPTTRTDSGRLAPPPPPPLADPEGPSICSVPNAISWERKGCRFVLSTLR